MGYASKTQTRTTTELEFQGDTKVTIDSGPDPYNWTNPSTQTISAGRVDCDPQNAINYAQFLAAKVAWSWCVNTYTERVSCRPGGDGKPNCTPADCDGPQLQNFKDCYTIPETISTTVTWAYDILKGAPDPATATDSIVNQFRKGEKDTPKYNLTTTLDEEDCAYTGNWELPYDPKGDKVSEKTSNYRNPNPIGSLKKYTSTDCYGVPSLSKALEVSAAYEGKYVWDDLSSSKVYEIAYHHEGPGIETVYSITDSDGHYCS